MHRDAAIAAVDPASEELKALVAAATGNFRLSGKHSPVLDKVRHRLAHNGLSSLSQYLDLLRHGEAGKRELDDLIAELTVGETFFFRHPDHFDALRDHVLPEVMKRNEASRQLRIWSAGCSNGAEAYSIAILVHSVLGPRIKDWNVSIVGSDINRAFLAEAEAGIYTAWTLRGLPKEQSSAFFEKTGQQWALRESYKQNVHFVYHNIISEEMPSLHKNIFAFDIVFCRNVMIYFDSEVNRRLAERIRQVMVDDGWLFVGSTDFNPHLDANFTVAKTGEAILFRKRSPSLRPVGRGERQAVAEPAPPTAAARMLPPRRAPPIRRRSPPARRAAAMAVLRPEGEAALADPAIQAIVDLANSGDWQNAELRCQELLAADPVNAPAHYYYALVLQSTGSHTEAEKALRRAIYLDRGFALAHYQFGLARKDAHDMAGCVRALRNTLDALERVPDERPISPCGRITAQDLRELTMQQLEILDVRP
jgi:chemotaxis protein methyltransferase CheR